VSHPLPLAAASQRLQRPPGRPPKPRPEADALALRTSALAPRLLDLRGSASYLALSTWSVRDLEAAGILKRVRVPLPGGREVRRVLFDREDLDRLIEQWKEEPA
jgi:hypothetical protein